MRSRRIAHPRLQTREHGLEVKMGTEIGLCCLLSLLLYWNTLNADFCYDDSRAIQKNPDLLPETPISDIFYNDFWGTPLTHSGSHKSYRPLCVLTFRLNYFLGGLNPVGYHLVNVLLHCVVTGLFTYSVRILCAKRLVSAVAGALFAAHPIHTEAVAGIVGRADILACLFFLLSFLCYIQYCSIRDQSIHKSASLSWRWIYMIMMGLSASASMLSKEQGVTVLGVCAIYDILVCHRVSWRQLLKCLYQKQFRRLHEGLVCIGLTAAGLIGFRLYFMGNKPPEFAPADNPASDSASFLTRTLTFLHLPVVNFWLLLFPKTLSFDWSMEAIPLIDVRTVIRNCDWSNEENLYKSGLHVNPAKAWGNLANILNGQGKLEEAEAAYHEALQHRGNMADVHYNLGILLQEQKRYSEAVEAYKNAIDCRPRLTMAHLNLGIVYGILKLYQEAERTYRHCAQIDTKGLKDPRLHDNTKISALYNLGRLLADQNRVKEAISIYHSAISRMPSHYSPQSLYNMLGEAYAKANEFDNAEKWYRKALHAKPGHIPAHLTIARLMQKKGLHHEAEEWYKKALRISSNDSTIYQHYAQFLGDIGNHKEAAETFVEASRLSPNDFELLFNAANALRQANMNYEAEQYYVLAAKLKPENPTAHMNLGAMLHFNGKLQEAEQSYLRALQLKPDDIVTQTNLKKLRNLLRKAKFENRA
ncbi:unnamed protein product [Owenia fusiformis]|uniref:dolichyl-phosphate-mannose--protein mannosyltransferase n=1 Tax=Owenia fusiformis TaxID=6347 RepID=A0A8S4Q002_OWEFU|nr:unnamed protein product [Owenia fusiformis]